MLSTCSQCGNKFITWIHLFNQSSVIDGTFIDQLPMLIDYTWCNYAGSLKFDVMSPLPYINNVKNFHTAGNGQRKVYFYGLIT